MTPTLRRSIALAFALAAFAGCAGEAPVGAAPRDPDITLGDLQATVLDDELDAGQVVDVRFVNLTSATMLFSSCGRGVERWTDGAWVPMPPELRLCIAALDPLEAQSATTMRIDVSADATPGYYRFRFDLYRETQPGAGDPHVLHSSIFEVR